MTIPVPSLSARGWITDSSAKFDTIWSHCLSSDYNQSEVYNGNVTNLQKVFEMHQKVPENCCQALIQTLTIYLARYYPEGVSVNCRYELLDPDTSGTQVKYTVVINFTENGVAYSADKILAEFQGSFTNIAKANNA